MEKERPGLGVIPLVTPPPPPENPWREMWTHEDHLINYRLTWLLVAQTLLFTGYAGLLEVLLDGQKNVRGHNRDILLSLVKDVIPALGGIIAIVVLLGVVAALWAMYLIGMSQPDPNPTGSKWGVHLATTILGWLSSGLLPIVFALVWLVVRSKIASML